MKLYAYCLAEGLDTARNLERGISNVPVRLIRIDNVAVLVSDAEMDAVPVTRENALVHAAVVRSVLDQTTPLPFRFGTVVTEEQLRSYIVARKPALEHQLAHVRGCIEMSIKIISKPSDEVRPNQPSEEADEPRGAGAAFLAEKRREILGDERRAAHAAEIAAWLHECVSAVTREEQVTVRPSERLILAAAHLVERVQIQTYRDKINAARGSRPELHFLASGPWPPYSFANIELEFKTRFGVS